MNRTIALFFVLLVAAGSAAAHAAEAQVAFLSPQAAVIGGAPVPTALLARLGVDDPTVVRPGETVEWLAWIRLRDGGWGLAFVSLDIVQDASNTQPVDLPRGDGPPAGMEPFDRPLGLSNPGDSLVTSGYGGTPAVDEAGRAALIQIGGAQNTFGAAPPCLGPDATVCLGQQALPTSDIASGRNGQVVATGRFAAPAVPGLYTYRVRAARVHALDARPVPGEPTRVRRAEVDLDAAWFVLDVRGPEGGVAPGLARDGAASPAPAGEFAALPGGDGEGR